MTHAACVLTQKDEELLLRPWLLYHGYLFGFENLHVHDAGSSRDHVLATLREFAALGVQVELASDGETNDAAVQEVFDRKQADCVFPLACDEFVAINGNDGIACDQTAILDEIRRIHENALSCRISRCLESLPGHLDLFRYLESGAGIALGPETDTDFQAAARSTALILIRLGRNPVDHDDYRMPLLRFAGLTRLLGAFTPLDTFRQGWELQGLEPLPEHALELDLNRHPFRGPGYLQANPDLSGLDPLAHFMPGGYFEGRSMEASDPGRYEVLDRMAAFRDRRPDGKLGYVGIANALGPLKRAHEGEAIIEYAIRQFGATRELVKERALLATKQKSHALAARRWDTFRCLFPAEPEGYGHGACERRLNGDLAGAQRIVAAGLEKFPQDVGLMSEQRETQFLLRARRLEESDTHDGLRRDGPVDVLMSEEETQSALRFLNLPNVEALRDFFLGFESLGHSCEFGLVQRHFGANPLCLLRWNSIRAAMLIEALEERFAGIDEASNLALINAGGEHVMEDSRYHTRMHTFYSVKEIDSDTLMRQTLKRMTYLRGKLISDLEQGEKIFVHLDKQSLSKEDLARLGRAMRSYGENTLLYVRVADTPALVGTVELAGDGLFVGYIDRQGAGDDEQWHISFEYWLALCREVSRLARSVPSSPPQKRPASHEATPA